LVSYENNYRKIIKNPKRDLVKLYYLKATRRPWVPFFNPGNAANAQHERYISAITSDTKFARPDPTMLYRMAYQEDVPGYNIYEHGDEIDLSGQGVFVNQYNDYSKVTDSEHIYK